MSELCGITADMIGGVMATKNLPDCLKKLVSDDGLFKDFKSYLKQKYKTGFGDDGINRPRSYENYNRQLNRIKAFYTGSASQKRSGVDAWDKYLRHDFQTFLYDRSLESYSSWFKQTYGQDFVPSVPDRSMVIIRDGEGDDFDFRGSFSGEDLYHYIGSLLGVLAGVPVVVDCSTNRKGIDVGVGRS